MDPPARFNLPEPVLREFIGSPTLDAVPEAVIVIDHKGEIAAFNDAATRIFGYAREEAIGRELAELIIPPHLREAHRIAFKRFRAGGEPRLIGRRVELEGMRSDSTTLRVELSLVALRPDPLVVAGFLRDVTERRRVEAEGEEMRALFAAAEAVAHLGSWSWDPETDEAVWSDELFRIHGYEPGSVEPSIELALSHMTPEDRQAAIEGMRAYREERPGAPPQERRLIRADGVERIVTTRSQVGNESGRGKVIGIIQDITEARVAEAELKSYLAAAESLRGWRLEEGVTGLLSRLGTPLGWEYGAVWLPTPAGLALFCEDSWSAPGQSFEAFDEATRRLSFPRGRGLVGRAWAQEDPVGIENLSEDETYIRGEVAAESGLASGLAFPALRGGGIVGVFEFYGSSPRRLSAELARALTSTGFQLGYYIEHRGAPGRAPGPLSEREREVLTLAASGSSTARIADELALSPETVKTHFERIYAKLEVSDRAAAVAQGFRRGLIT